MDDISPDLLAIIPCISDFLDVDGSEMLAAASVSTDFCDETTLITAMLLNPSLFTASATRTSDIESNEPLVDTTSLSGNKFQQEFRMHRPTYWKLLSIIKEHNSDAMRQDKGKEVQTFENNILVTLHYLGSQKSLLEISKMFYMTESCVENTINTTVNSIYDAIQHFVSWPNSSEKVRINDGFQGICKLPNILGGIGATHLECLPGNHLSQSFYPNAGRNPSIILQAVCDHEMRFLHCCTGWPGTLDCRSVLHDSDLFQDIVEDCSHFLEDSYFVGDEGYPLYPWLITPYVKETEKLSGHKSHFNFCHSLALNSISKTFLHLKRRFPRLNSLNADNLEFLVKTVLVSCALHNLCINQGEDTLFTENSSSNIVATSTSTTKLSSSSSSLYSKDTEKLSVQNGSQKRDMLSNYLKCFMKNHLHFSNIL